MKKKKMTANINKYLPNKYNISFWLLGIFLTWLIIVFMCIPNIHVILMSLFQDGHFTLEPIKKILASDRAIKSIEHSFILALILPLTVNILGIFIVLVTEYFDIKGSKILRIGYMTTLVFSGMVLANGYLFVYGNHGWMTTLITQINPNLDPNWFEGFPAVLFMMTFACTSYHILFFRNSIRGIDFQTVEAAKNMGASQFEILSKVVFPTVMPMIVTMTVMTAQIGLSALSGPLMVGGENFQTISPMILSFASSPASRDLAAVLSIALGIFQFGLLYILTRNEKKGNYISISKTKTKITKQKINNKVLNILTHIIAWLLWLIYIIPVISVLIFSFTDTLTQRSGHITLKSFTLEHYIHVFTNSRSYGPFVTSALYSALTAIIVVLLAVLCARLIIKYKNKLTGLLEYSLYIPWLLPGILIALGLMITYDKPHLYLFNQVLLGTLVLLLIGYIIISIPFAMRMIKSAYYSFDQNLEDAAKNLGAGSIKTYFKVILPMILPTALAVAALTFNGRLSDYDISAFLSHALHPTIGMVIKSNTDPNASVDAQAISLVYSVILMFINAIVIYYVYERKTKDKKKK